MVQLFTLYHTASSTAEEPWFGVIPSSPYTLCDATTLHIPCSIVSFCRRMHPNLISSISYLLAFLSFLITLGARGVSVYTLWYQERTLEHSNLPICRYSPRFDLDPSLAACNPALCTRGGEQKASLPLGMCVY